MTVSTVRYLLESAVEKTPDKVAIVDNEKKVTFSELFFLVNKVAAYLNNLNLEPGSRVAIYSNKSIEQVISTLAVLSTNYIVVPISSFLKTEQVEYIIKDCDVKCIITDKSKVTSLNDIEGLESIITMDQKVNSVTFSEIYDMELPYRDFINSSQNSAAIIYSSGSTGFPKGIVSSHKNLFDGARIVSSYLKLKQDDIISGVLSFNFDYGLNQIYCMLYKNATLALHNYFFPKDFFNHLVRDNITVLPLMPVFLSRIFDQKMVKNLDKSLLKNIRLICSSGGKITATMLENIENYFPETDFYSMYGLTEAFRSTYLEPEQVKIRPTSIGKAIPDVELYVINDEGNECKPNERGELIHRGGCIGKGYWNRTDETNERYKSISILKNVLNLQGSLVDELVVCSGDYVYKDEEGYIYFVSRKDDMIKSSGYRISPFEIESCVYQNYKAIQECAIFSIEHQEIGQEIIMAYTSDTEVVQSDLIFELKKHLPNYMIPTIIYRRQSMPITTANQGKINKTIIKKEFLESKID